MKKTLALLLALVMVLGLAACGNQNSTPTTADSTPAESTPEQHQELDSDVSNDFALFLQKKMISLFISQIIISLTVSRQRTV